jgi:hypothetical protein
MGFFREFLGCTPNLTAIKVPFRIRLSQFAVTPVPNDETSIHSINISGSVAV